MLDFGDGIVIGLKMRGRSKIACDKFSKFPRKQIFCQPERPRECFHGKWKNRRQHENIDRSRQVHKDIFFEFVSEEVTKSPEIHNLIIEHHLPVQTLRSLAH
jgi:hypothetical protein